MRIKFTRLMRMMTTCMVASTIPFAFAGCGGGAGSYNIDDGFYTDGRGNKTITRTLDNRTDHDAEVDLEINGREYLDTVFIRRDDYINITIERMRVEDYVWFRARFDNGDTTEGTFSEDGVTVFTNSRAGAGGVTSTGTDGAASIKPGGQSTKLDAGVKRAPR